jgi:hypothetical protein
MIAKRLTIFMGPFNQAARRVNLYSFEPALQIVILNKRPFCRK